MTKQILGAALISIRSSSPKLKSARSYDSMKPLVSTTRIEMAVFTGEPPTQKGAIRKTLKEHKKGKITNPVSIKLIKENPINVSRSGCRRDWPSASVFAERSRKAPVADQPGTHSRGQQYRPDSKRHESGSGYSGEYSDSVTLYSYLRRPLHKGPFRLESGKFVSMTRFYSRNLGYVSAFGGHFREFPKYGRIYPVRTDLRTPYRVRILSPFADVTRHCRQPIKCEVLFSSHNPCSRQTIQPFVGGKRALCCG